MCSKHVKPKQPKKKKRGSRHEILSENYVYPVFSGVGSACFSIDISLRRRCGNTSWPAYRLCCHYGLHQGSEDFWVKEKEWMKRVMLAVSARDDCTIFRVNVGTGWVSAQKPIKHPDGAVTLIDARPLSSGLPPGFHDLLGIQRRVITPDMVGQEIGQFFTIETKTKTGRVSAVQDNFKRQIERLGGRSIISRPGDDIQEYFDDDRHE